MTKKRWVGIIFREEAETLRQAYLERIDTGSPYYQKYIAKRRE